MEGKGVGSSSISFTNQSLNGGTLVNLEQRRIEIELAAREAENKKLREEIAMKAELLKERELEDKIIRKFMAEGNFGPRQILSVLGSESSSIAAANMKSPLLNSHQQNEIEIEGSRVLPFQREPKATMTAIPKPVFNLCKEAPSHLVKSVMNAPAAADPKGKFKTGTNAEKLSIYTKAQKEWSCDLCKVKTSCEDLLKGHLIGKKHLAKEKALNILQNRAAKTEPSLEMKVVPPKLPTSLMGPVADKTVALAPPSLPNAPVEPSVEIKVAPPRLPNSSMGLVVNEVHVASAKRKFEPVIENCEDTSSSMVAEKKQIVDWKCSLCNVITTGEEQLKTHLNGKKHKAKEHQAKKKAALTQPKPTGLDMELVQPSFTSASTKAVASEHLCTLCDFTAKDEDEMYYHKRDLEHLRRFMENGGALTQIQPMCE